MTENVCVTCQYYESCNRPERFMKCMGYKEKQERGEENAQQRRTQTEDHPEEAEENQTGAALV